MANERELDAVERGLLVTLLKSEGWKVLQNIMEIECEKYKVQLLNVLPGNNEEILARHALAKASAQFLTGVIARLNAEIETYYNASRIGDKPLDITAGLLDMDDNLGEG